MSYSIVLNNVIKKYGKNDIIKNVDLNIDGGIFGLLGRNGAGKTTLMNLIIGLEEPTSGTITINGIDLRKNKLEVKGIIGYLPQEFTLYPELTGVEFLDYIARLNNLKDVKQRYKVVQDILEKVNLLGVKDKRIDSYSGGMKQRLGIAQALVKNPGILIVDEPTAGLDPEERIKFRTMLVELSRSKTVLMSTHIVEDISASCDHIGILDSGQLRYVGTPSNFIKIAADKVWECEIKSIEELIKLKNTCTIISVNQTQCGIRARIVGCNIEDFSTRRSVEPTLEDAYILFMQSTVGCDDSNG